MKQTLAVLSVLGHGAHPALGESVTTALLEGLRSHLRSSQRTTTERKNMRDVFDDYLDDLAEPDAGANGEAESTAAM